VRRVAAALAFASAAVSAYWLAGGTALLDTVGGEVERLARERSAGAVAALAVIVALKLLAGALALRLARPRPVHVRLGLLGGALLAIYGGLLVAAGAVVLAGAGDPPEDPYALRWHVLFWDLWFLVWGVAWFLAARRARVGLRAAG
jgi:hypothetical protein